MKATNEMSAWKVNGFLALLFTFGMMALCIPIGIAALAPAVTPDGGTNVPAIISLIALIFLIIVSFCGMIVVQPNESRVLLFFGKYVGTINDDGFWWVNPFTGKYGVSLKTRNFNSDELKVNDQGGNPIEIGAVIVWRVVSPAKAILDVENYGEYVDIQVEIAIRSLAAQYPYDSNDEKKASLRDNPQEIIENLRTQVQGHLSVAGIEILEARISHLAYAPEIAQAMLRRQQAEAVVAARHKIVEGAVSMVKMALGKINEDKLATFTEDKKAALVSNLMVVLVSDKEATPVVNTGTQE